MNSGTLVGSLIFAAVLVVAIAVAIQLMMLGGDAGRSGRPD